MGGNGLRSGVLPFWVHTIELDSNQRLAGAIVVVEQSYLPRLSEMSRTDGDAFIQAHGRETWLRLPRAAVVNLIRAAGKQRPSDVGYVPTLYSRLVVLQNALLNEG